MAGRSPEEIRASIVATREELAYSINDLSSKINELSDWRRQLSEHREAALVTAAVAGFIIGGGIAAALAVFR